jgi:hypothetical protein
MPRRLTLALATTLLAVVTAGAVELSSFAELPAQRDVRGRALMTVLPLRTENDLGMFHLGWYVGDAARTPAEAFCNVAMAPLKMTGTYEDCVSILEVALLNRAEEVAAKVFEVAEVKPVLQPFFQPSQGFFNAMEGFLPNLGEEKWRPGVYKDLLARRAKAEEARQARLQAEDSSKVVCWFIESSSVFLCLCVCRPCSAPTACCSC